MLSASAYQLPLNGNLAKYSRRGECEISPKPRGSLYGAQQNRLQIADMQSKLLA